MNCNTARYRRYVRLSFLMLVCLSFCLSAPVKAQSVSKSHRRLELPEGGSSDISRQMMMLKRLQTLLGNQQTNNGSSGNPPVSPDQMNMIRQLMKSFGGQAPEDLVKQLDNLPPEIVSSVANDPAARRQIRDMLEQYSRNRQLPDGGRRSGMPVLPPQSSDRSSGTDSRRSTERNTGTSKAGNPGSRNQSETESTSIDDLLKKLKDFERKHLSGQNGSSKRNGQDRNSTVQNSQRPQSTGRTPSSENSNTKSGSDSDMPQTEDGWAAKIEELIRQQRRQQNGTPPGSGGTQQTSTGDQQFSSSDTDVENQIEKLKRRFGIESEHGQSESSESEGQAGITSVSDFLKEFSDMEPEETGGPKPQTSRSAGRKPTVGETERGTSAIVEQTQQEVKSELAQKGFRETLKRIARDAKRQAEAARPVVRQSSGESEEAGASAGSGFSAAMSEALTGVTKDLVEIVKDAKFRPPKPSRSSGSSGAAGSNSSRSSSKSTLGRLRSTASDFISDVATSATSSPDMASGPLSGGGSVEIGGSAMLPIAVLVALVSIGIAVAWKFGLVGPGAQGAGAAWRMVTAKDIRSKADVIRAFHQMALKPDRNGQEWWTHQKVVEELVEQKPDRSVQATTLSSLYEQARYLPEDTEFTPEQIRDAKLALTQCER